LRFKWELKLFGTTKTATTTTNNKSTASNAHLAPPEHAKCTLVLTNDHRTQMIDNKTTQTMNWKHNTTKTLITTAVSQQLRQALPAA